MDFKTYQEYFQTILDDPSPKVPYDSADYFGYTELNWSRMHRWLKKGELSESVKKAAAAVDSAQYWIIITEPWCGDAAHVIPFLEMIAALNPLIHVDYELRDSEPYRINDYLTNGGKSIPKLIIRDGNGKDLATWGPRPAGAQQLYGEMMSGKADFETVKITLQQWYNADKGKQVQEEIAKLLESVQ